jgi:hypothetical protein
LGIRGPDNGRELMIEMAIAVCVTFVLGGAVGSWLLIFYVNKGLSTEKGRKAMFEMLCEKASAEEVQRWRREGVSS